MAPQRAHEAPDGAELVNLGSIAEADGASALHAAVGTYEFASVASVSGSVVPRSLATCRRCSMSR